MILGTNKEIAYRLIDGSLKNSGGYWIPDSNAYMYHVLETKNLRTACYEVDGNVSIETVRVILESMLKNRKMIIKCSCGIFEIPVSNQYAHAIFKQASFFGGRSNEFSKDNESKHLNRNRGGGKQKEIHLVECGCGVIHVVNPTLIDDLVNNTDAFLLKSEHLRPEINWDYIHFNDRGVEINIEKGIVCKTAIFADHVIFHEGNDVKRRKKHSIRSQEELNHICNNDPVGLEQIGIDIFEDNRFFLIGDEFYIDCSSTLLRSYPRITFIGSGNTIVKVMNCEKGNSFGSNEEVDIYDFTTNTTFQNAFITTDDFIEIRFYNREELNHWNNVTFDTAKVRVIVTEEEINHFFNSYDVEGALEPGDHVVVRRGLYTHHGIFVGNNRLIHYSGSPRKMGSIEYITLDQFARSDVFWVYEHKESFSKDEVINRAKSRLMESQYNLIFNNCEHFCHWCCTGQKWSNQVAGYALGRELGYFISSLANDGGAKKYRLSR